MKSVIVKQGSIVNIYSGSDLDVSGCLPPAVYELGFNIKTGYFLEEISPEFNTTKLYGEAAGWVQRVLTSFKSNTSTNLGVLFSGPTGLGKSLAVRHIAELLFNESIPVIYIKKNIGDFTSFFDSIVSRCVVVLDEFEKLYPDQLNESNDDLVSQSQILNIFDSHFQSNKLILVTVNDLHRLTPFLLNRPGRLHYHFEVTGISAKAIKEYCRDFLFQRFDFDSTVADIIRLAGTIPFFSYDMLKALIDESNLYPNDSVDSLFSILNIHTSGNYYYSVHIEYEDSTVAETDETVNFKDSSVHIGWWYLTYGWQSVTVATRMAKPLEGADIPGTMVFYPESFMSSGRESESATAPGQPVPMGPVIPEISRIVLVPKFSSR